MTVDTAELRRMREEPGSTYSSWRESGGAYATWVALPELLDELDRMRPYAVRCGWFEDMETAEEWLSEC